MENSRRSEEREKNRTATILGLSTRFLEARTHLAKTWVGQGQKQVPHPPGKAAGSE